MRASLARQVKFSIVQYNSVFYIFNCKLHWLDRLSFQLFNTIQFFYIDKCGLHWLDRLSFQLFNTIQFFIYLNAGFTGSTG